jgi:hypothetical protein
MTDRFGGYDTGKERQLLDAVWDYVIKGHDREINREKEAERRHKELLGKVDTIVGAFTAGLRAFADTVDRQMRR